MSPDNHWKAVNSDHRTTIIPLRMVAIDNGIIPVIKWLNSLSDTVTLYSCEGTKDQQPIVCFFCRFKYILSDIKDEVSVAKGKVEPDYIYHGGKRNPHTISSMQVLSFPTKAHLAKFKRYLKKKGKS